MAVDEAGQDDLAGKGDNAGGGRKRGQLGGRPHPGDGLLLDDHGAVGDNAGVGELGADLAFGAGRADADKLGKITKYESHSSLPGWRLARKPSVRPGK